MASFGDAFKAARSAGKKTFSFNGKLYHTKTKDEMAKTKASVPVPTPRPTNDTGAQPAAPERAMQDYPRPSVQVGIARPGSTISKAVARKENEPVDPNKKKATGFRRGLQIQQ